MKAIILTRGRIATVDDADFEELSKHKWHAIKPSKKYPVYYAARGAEVNGKRVTLLMARVLLNAPADREVDHKNRDTLDNRRHNLRLATSTQNKGNFSVRQSNGACRKTSQFKGVAWHPQNQNWRADITVNGVHKYLGAFSTPEEAAGAYDEAARKFFGEFAAPNFPTENNTTNN